MGEHDCVGGVMMTFGGVPFEAKRGSLRPDGPSGSGIRSAFIAATALSLFVVSGFSYADDRADDAGNAATAGRPAAAATEWPEIDATTSDDDDPAVVTASPSAPTTGQAGETPDAADDEDPRGDSTETPAAAATKSGTAKAGTAADAGTAVPFGLVGPETGTGRYVYWNLRVGGTTSASPLVGGGTFELQFGGTSSTASWVNPVFTVVDCVAETTAQCTGYDKDPDAGEFQVPDGAVGPEGSLSIPSSVRPHVRVRPASSPSTWLTDGATWSFVTSTSTWLTGRFSSTSAASLALSNSQAARVGLTWDLRNGTTTASPLVGAGAFELQGPANGTGSSAWSATTTFRVVDCTEAPCSGYDSDPTPGSIQVVGGATGPEGTIPALASNLYWRLRPAASPAQWQSEGLTWGFVTSPSAWAYSGRPAGANGSVYLDMGDLVAASAYVTWDVRATTSESSALIGGATFELRNNAATGTVFRVPDCRQAPCTGYDSDPSPGRFTVANGATDADGANPIVMSNADRWGYRPQQSPTFWDYDGTLHQFATGTPTGWTTMSSATLWAGSNGAYSYDFGNIAATPISLTGTMTVTVRKRVLANPTSVDGSVSSNIGTTSTYTEGARFRLYTNLSGNEPGDPIAASWASCEVPANSGECVITVPGASGGLSGQRFWVVEEAPRPGSPAADTYANPELYVGDAQSPGPQDLRRLVGLTRAAQNNRADFLPMTASGVSGGTALTNNDERPAGSSATNAESGSFGAVANSLKNKTIPPLCTNLKVAIVLDESGSVGRTNWDNMRAAVAGTGSNSVMAILQGKAAVSILSFDTTVNSGDWRFGTAAQPVQVTAANRQQIYDSLNAYGAGWTNWDAGLSAIENAATTFDLVLFVTDGAPNYIYANGSGVVAGGAGEVTLRALEAPIYAANAIKHKGSRIVAVGVGGGASGATTGKNLRAVSGEISGSDYVQGDWDKINAMLTDAVKQATCTVPIEVDKTEVVGATSTPNRPGWVFGAAKTGTHGQLVGPTPATGTTTATNGVTWDLNFTAAGQSAGITLTETNKPDWLLTDVACTVGGIHRDVTIANGSVTIDDLGPTSGKVHCTFTNTKVQTGALSVAKAFDGVPSGYGNVPFSGTYTCRLGETSVSTGTWSRTGAGAGATIATTSGAAYDKLPAGASCTVEETAVDGRPLTQNSQGLPNSSWIWGEPGYAPDGGEATIVADQTANVVVTNTTERAYGAFSVEKVVEGTADDDLVYGGDWQCVLAGETTVTGTWSTGAGETWTSPTDEDIPLGAQCSVVNESTRPSNPVADDPSYTWDGQPAFSAPVAAAVDPLGVVTVTNRTKRVLGAVTWTKVDGANGPLLAGSAWTVVGPGADGPSRVVTDCVAAGCEGPDRDPIAGRFRLEGLLWGSYTVTESTVPEGYTGVSEFTFTVGQDNAGATLNLGQKVNIRIPGTVAWQKVDGSDPATHLQGSEWEIRPTNPTGAAIAVTDCVADVAAACPSGGRDVDPAAGRVTVEGLAWGEYELVETKAPPGYRLDATRRPFEITAADRDHVFIEPIVNTLRSGPVLPLTGGLGRDHVYLAGALLLLLSLAGFGAKRLRAGRITRRA